MEKTSLQSPTKTLAPLTIQSAKAEESQKHERLFLTQLNDHKNRILQIFYNQKRREIISVDDTGLLSTINMQNSSSSSASNDDMAIDNSVNCYSLIDSTSSEVTCVTCSHTSTSTSVWLIFLGCSTGSIWKSNLEDSEKLNYRHYGRVCAVAMNSDSDKLFSAGGVDKRILIFDYHLNIILQEIKSDLSVVCLHLLSSITGQPLAISDEAGTICVWDTTGTPGSNVQLCGHLKSKPLVGGIFTVSLFGRSCLVCAATKCINVWSIAEAAAQAPEVLRG